MEYVFAFVGLPREVHIRLREVMPTQTSNHQLIYGSTFDAGKHFYTERDISRLQKTLADKLEEDLNKDQSKQKAYCVVCVQHDEHSTDELIKAFFPEVLVISLPCKLDGQTPTQRNYEVNEMVKQLQRVIRRAKETLKGVRQEITSKANVTPLLLPVKNFKSRTFDRALYRLSRKLAKAEAVPAVLKDFVATINNVHPPQSDPGTPAKGRRRYVDGRGIHFVPPGKHRHGLLRNREDHKDKCLLASHLRLGAPYDPSFHYDCQKGKMNLTGKFFSCHADEKNYVGRPHLNIATSDFIR